jgi:hypothetical protein
MVSIAILNTVLDSFFICQLIVVSGCQLAMIFSAIIDSISSVFAALAARYKLLTCFAWASFVTFVGFLQRY